VILSGPIRDYTAFNGFPNPYRTPNFCFLGDDSSSAGAMVNIADVTLVPAPTLVIPAAGVLGWQGIPNQTYTVETTTNLINWNALGSVTAPTAAYWFTNPPIDSVRLFRLVHE
jgi:hypothetical protein